MGMFAGSVASLTVLGALDLILVSLTEFAGDAVGLEDEPIAHLSDLSTLSGARAGLRVLPTAGVWDAHPVRDSRSSTAGIPSRT